MFLGKFFFQSQALEFADKSAQRFVTLHLTGQTGLFALELFLQDSQPVLEHNDPGTVGLHVGRSFG